VIWTIKTLTDRTFREARELLQQLPTVVLNNVPARLAEDIGRQLEQAGGTVVVQPMPPNTASEEADPSIPF
jgi:ribosomal protein L7/L12